MLLWIFKEWWFLFVLLLFTAYISKDSGVFCDENRQGRDVSFRAFYDYYSSYQDAFNPDGLFQYTLSGFSQTHWSYDRDMPSFTSVTYDYTELSMYLCGWVYTKATFSDSHGFYSDESMSRCEMRVSGLSVHTFGTIYESLALQNLWIIESRIS